MTILEKILDFIKNEPVAVGSVVLALVQAIVGLLVAFNVNLTQEQQTAIFTLIAALMGVTVLVATVVRGNVTPTVNPKTKEKKKLVPEFSEEVII